MTGNSLSAIIRLTNIKKHGKTRHQRQITGSIGPVSYHSYNGNVYLQSKPGKGNVKHSAATKNSASDFGRASKLAKAIRLSLFPIMQGHEGNALYRRFTTIINRATQKDNPQPKGSRLLIDGDLSTLAHIDCNTGSPFASSCGLSPRLSLSDSRQLTLALPAFTIANSLFAPSDATDAALTFLVIAIDPETRTESHADSSGSKFP